MASSFYCFRPDVSETPKTRETFGIAYTEWADPSTKRDLGGKTKLALQSESKEHINKPLWSVKSEVQTHSEK
jgi:hypothetical protein